MKKPVKIALLILGPLALVMGGAYVLLNRTQSGVASQFTYFDVVTGERFNASRTDRRVWVVPAPNADGERSIYPLTRDDEGQWIIQPHYHSNLLESFAEDERLLVDLDTFRVLTRRR
ncbi:MAG: hypothetical protein EA379_06730 [Phycisphaerales bacterium]|nr:MAG: hypothetical protein EA379_06730 [Phycisphaerales bacterium]